MYRKMLVLLDGSKLAEVVLKYAQELSARMNIGLELLHVCSPHETDRLPALQAYMRVMAEAVDQKTAEIHSGLGGIPAGRVKAGVKVLVGYPAEEIIKYADENNIDLIVLSSHGQSGVRVWDIGNVANKVIHASRVNIVMVPSGIDLDSFSKSTQKIILVPLDGTPFSEIAIPLSVSLAKQKGSEMDIVFVHVDDPAKKPPEINLDNYLNNIVKRVGEEGVKAGALLLKGNTAETIVNHIEKNPVQLIVMSTHEHKGLTTMVFSSVTENVLHMVKKAPILIVKRSQS